MTLYLGTNPIAGGGTVDQTYDGTSTNAQSGTAVAGAIATKADDNAVVKLTGDQTVAGIKTFTNVLFLDGTNIYEKTSTAKGTNPPTDVWTIFGVADNSGSADDNHRLGGAQVARFADGNTRTVLRAFENTANSTANAQIYVQMGQDSSVTTYAPACNNNNCIITQQGLSTGSNGYVKLGNGIMIQWGRVASGSANQTITFPQAWYNTDYALVCTTTPGNSSTKAAISVDSTSRTKTTVSVNIESNASSNWIGIGRYK